MDTRAHEFLPRKYQEEIFLQAQGANIIAALGTGSGKTFISALLVKWMALKDSSSFQSKVVIFLVPKVALVDQQGDFLSTHTPFKVIKLHGHLDIDLADRAGWRSRFEQFQIFVMTAQIFLNFLTHSLWSIDRTSLIIFDECHHARKKHAYNQIMNGFYFHVPPLKRPKIFGMTASPIWDTNDAVGSLASLEKNLDATVVGVKQHVSELELHTPKPIEVIEVFSPPPEMYPHDIYLFRALHTFSDILSTIESIEWSKLETRYHSALYNLGPYCAELFLFYEMDFRIKQAINDSVPASIDADVESNEYITLPGLTSQFKSLHPDIIHVQSIIDDYRPFFLPNDLIESTSTSVQLSQFTPKVAKLVSILLSHNSSLNSSEIPSTGLEPLPPSPLAPFQTIIFVEQRHIASCLAHIIPRIDELDGMFASGVLLGEGIGLDKAPRPINSVMGGEAIKGREETLNMFRRGEINVLVATSVAEEGLDFPACSLIIRYDPLQHLVGYVQSRGRARNKVASKFVVMIREDDQVQLDRYKKFLQGEPELRKILETNQAAQIKKQSSVEEDEDDEDEEESDAIYELNLQNRERYVVPETGATLNYDNAINLLGHLCALIPCDAFTPTHAPKYIISTSCNDSSTPPATTPIVDLSCGYSCTLRLPASLPLPPSHLSFVGPTKFSKKEAKRAVAFQAVRALREYDVFDAYLLPTSSGSTKRGRKSAKGKTDVDGRGYADVSTVEPMMDVIVRNPWYMGPCAVDSGLVDERKRSTLWVHAVWINGGRSAGIVADSLLPPCQVRNNEGVTIKLNRGKPLVFCKECTHESEENLHRWMKVYTERGIWYRITGRPLDGYPSFYVVPLLSGMSQIRVDFDALQRFAQNPYGSYDWSDITPEHYDRLLIMNNNQYGRPYLLRRIREDLSPQSIPPQGSREDIASTFYDYWIERWTRKNYEARVPEDGPLIEAYRLPRYHDGTYGLYQRGETEPVHTASNGALLPQGSCAWIDMSPEILKTFEVLPILAHRISDLYRAKCARLDFGLPAIQEDLLVEAFTLPSADAPHNNQRLETLGDSVLKLCVTVHAFNKFPHRHEGQLTIIRQCTVSNWCLLARAKELGLESYLISEKHQNVAAWPYCQDRRRSVEALMSTNDEGQERTHRHTARSFARRSLQDCMEATLGAAFLTGGIPMALYAGESLGLAFGGTTPWPWRYKDQSAYGTTTHNSALFTGLQAALGYNFRRPNLIVEAMTHPSFASESGGQSYQRLEFLGDALLDLVVVHYLYNKFPQATSHQLSFPRARAICSLAFAWVGIQKLQLHKFMLINNIELSASIAQYVPILEECSAEEIVKRGWRYDPPKAISDAFESLFGAILIDSGWDYDKTAVIAECVMEDVLEELSPTLQLYPISELHTWVAMSGCTELKWQKTESGQLRTKAEGVSVLIHGTVVAGPIISPSLTLAKHAAAERALAALREPDGEKSLSRLCTCRGKGVPPLTLTNVKDGLDELDSEEEEVKDMLLSGV